MGETKKRKKKAEPLEEIEQELPADDGGDEDGFVIKRPPWVLRVEDLDLDIPLTGLKLPTFTTGMIDRGDITIETINIPDIALNKYFRTWLWTPRQKKIEIRTFDTAGMEVEVWKMVAVPAAMGFSELNVQDDAPWVTQVAFTVNEIAIDPINQPS